MLSDKGTNIFSEIGKFFKENDATSAMNAIIDITKALRLSEKRLFGSESKCNCKLTQLQVLGDHGDRFLILPAINEDLYPLII